MRKLGVVGTILLLLAVAPWMVGDRLLARPRGLRVEHIPHLPAPVSLERTEFCSAVRDLDLESATATGDSAERRRFVGALRMVVAGDAADAVDEFQALLSAEEPDIREESRAALVRLLRSLSRWRELAEVEPGNLDAAAYRDAPHERFNIPANPVRLPTKIGWLRIPRVPVVLNGRSYQFAVDTGTSATVITDELAAECGITASKESRQEETSTSRRIEWRTGLARELRLGEMRIDNHPLSIVPKEDLDFGFIQMDGVIGWTLFQHLRVEIDYARGETVLSRSEPTAGPRNFFWLGYPMVTLLSPAGVSLHFGLDTGARDTTLKPNMSNKVDLGSVETGQGITIGAGGGEASSRRRVRDFSMLLSNRRFRFERITMREGVKDLAVLAPDGQLGGDVALGGKMIIDFPNGQFTLEFPAAE